MEFNNVTTTVELDEILSAGSTNVREIYARFRLVFPTKLMKEIGLTDIFLMTAQGRARDANKAVKFEWMSEENKYGCDFSVEFNNGVLTNRKVYFQAKVVQKDGPKDYFDFLYESKTKDGKKTILEYQNLLLAEFAHKNNTEAYYVIYDDTAVHWVNVIALKNWLDRSGVHGTNMSICIRGFTELAKTSYLAAKDDPWLHHIMHIIIVGAGPAGLAAALALSQTVIQGSPPHITILELRPKVKTLGGTILLTPLALRYLDALGVGSRLRKLGIPIRGVDVVSLRTGQKLGQMLPGTDALRVMRHHLVQCMSDAVAELPKDRVTLRYGARVTDIQQVDDQGEDEGTVRVDAQFDVDKSQHFISCDVLLGCDGIHSFVRSTVVDRERRKTYSGRAIAYGYVDSDSTGQIGVMTSHDKSILQDSTMIQGQHGSFLMTYFEPSREKVYALAIMSMAENQDAREGWKALGEDKVTLKRDIIGRFKDGGIKGLEPLINESDWYFYPVYMLPPEGKWSKGRVLLLGDAAHAMPPQGESTGIAIEDGVLFAHVLSEGIAKGVPYVMEAYETLRRDDIKKLYDETMFRWKAGSSSSWLWSMFMEFATWVYLLLANYRQEDYFKRDVRSFKLP
ncbi:salicylate hydroxylase [Fusarium coicis]|nr:salicylate hydroxylase [Fusarium coicis]